MKLLKRVGIDPELLLTCIYVTLIGGIRLTTPQIICPYVSSGVELGNGLGAEPWSDLPGYGPFRLHNGTANSRYRTEVRTCWDDDHLYIAFRCQDEDILATMTDRDAPLYDQEVVEVFVAPRDLHNYFEFNVSPRNVVFDSLIHHDGTRFTGHPSWNCDGLRTVTRRDASPQVDQPDAPADGFGGWTAELAIPFRSLEALTPRNGDRWAINFYRIKRRPTDEYSCWSPTLLEPAQFHIPSRFGTLLFVEGER